jgi:chromosome segregation ATPase
MRRTLSILALLLTTLACFARERDRFTYVYSRGGSDIISLSHGSLESTLKIRKRYTGTYLWAQLDGRAYLIRDAATLDEVRRAVAPLDALNAELEPLHQKMKPLQRREEKIDRELDALTDNEDDEAPTAETRDRIRELERQQREVERELRDYEREEERLDRKEEALDRACDEEIRRIVERAVRRGVAEHVD